MSAILITYKISSTSKFLEKALNREHWNFQKQEIKLPALASYSWLAQGERFHIFRVILDQLSRLVIYVNMTPVLFGF